MKQEKDLKIFLHKINKLYSTKMIRYIVVDSQKLLRVVAYIPRVSDVVPGHLGKTYH